MHTLLSLGHSLIERGFSWFLAPISWIWASVVFCKNQAYTCGWLKAHRISSVIVSVGNIEAGGTGKTPFVHHLALSFSHRKVAILSRGYGKLPDEAMLLQNKLPQAKIYIGKDRTVLAKQATHDGAELILLDDGLQHRKLYRDFDIVLTKEERNKHYLPWGFLRDSPKRLQEAEAVFVRDRDFRLKVIRVMNQQSQVDICGWKVGLFCGLGNPKSFQKTIQELGAEVIGELFLGDHESVSLKRLELFRKGLKVNYLITTEKDAIKLPPHSLPILIVEIEIELTRGKEQFEKLIEKIDQKIDNRSTYE